MEATLKNGNPMFAIINTDLLDWDAKTSHPWILKFKIKYDGENNNYLTNEDTYKFLDLIEEEILN